MKDRPLKIAIVTHGYKPAYRLGGPIESVASLAEGLAERGHSVRVMATNNNLGEHLDVPTNQPVNIKGVAVWYFRNQDPLSRLPISRKSIGYLYAPSLRRHLGHFAPELDIIHTQIPFIYPTFAAATVARAHHVPLFYHQRGVLSPERLAFKGFKKAVYMRLFEGPILNSATCLIALTKDEQRDFGTLSPATPCRVIPNGIHVDQYRTTPTCEYWRQIPPDAPMVLFMGRIHPIKGADILLDAFISIANLHKSAHLVLAGPDEWGLEAIFRKRAEGFNSRIHFPGMLTGDHKINTLARANIFCLPSTGEGFSMAVLEAMASEVAVVLSPGCRFPEVRDHDAGMIAPNTTSETAFALNALLSDPQRMKSMARAARRLVGTKYRWDSVITSMEDAYRTYSQDRT